MMGIGAMLHELSGGSPKSAEKYYGKKIKAAEFVDDSMKLEFEDGVKIKIYDNGQSCCESRYMTCDDDVSDLVGKKLDRIEVKSFDSKDEGYDAHEIAFLEIQAEEVLVQFATHNEHNGYYGGFRLSIAEGEGR